jgi:hypothetical protein
MMLRFVLRVGLAGGVGGVGGVLGAHTQDGEVGDK